jgi:hypothetical protein
MTINLPLTLAGYWRPAWPAGGGEHFRVSPAQVRADPARHRVHYDRAMAADLAHAPDRAALAAYAGPHGPGLWHVSRL